jgi:uncharacterized protein (TIGR03000 family)
MYSVVLLIAVTSGSESIDCRGRKHRSSCHSCYSASVSYGCAGVSYASAGCYAPPPCGGVVVPNGGCSGVTDEQKKVFTDTIEELKSWGEEEAVLALVKEVEDLSGGSDCEAQKKWLDKYTPDITEDEQKIWDTYLKGIEDPKMRDSEKKAWEESSNPGKRYYLRYLNLVEASAPATLVVSLSPGTKLAIDKKPTTASSSKRRVFVTGTLEADKDYHYTLDATYTLNGAPVVVTKTVTLRAGKTTEVTLEPAVSVAASVPSR